MEDFKKDQDFIENEYGVAQIDMSRNVRCYCPLGKDWYSAKVTMTIRNMTVCTRIPNYCKVDEFISSLDGQKLILEEVAYKVKSFLLELTNSEEHCIVVQVTSEDAVHLPVIITI